MRRTRNKKVQFLNEGVYDFYETQQGADTADKIVNYYIDKIRKSGKGSLTRREVQIFKDANDGKLSLDNPIYKKNKLTGDLETDERGEVVRLDKEQLIPGMPFLTSKGKGLKKKEIINGRCYWDVDDETKYYYAFSVTSMEPENPTGLIIYKTTSKTGEGLGAFIVPKSDLKGSQPEELWKKINDKYDKGIILDKDMYNKFIKFDDLYHKSKKENMVELLKIYKELKNYPD